MIHDDYIMRLLNQFARGLARILAKRELGDPPGALEEIATTMHELFGLWPQFFHQVSEGELAAILKSSGRFNAEKAFMMAELLREHVEVTEELEGPADETADPLLLTSARLYADALVASEKLRTDEYAGPFVRLCERLQDYDLQADLLVKLMRGLEIVGEFSKAEDALYRLMDVDERRGVEAGLVFYEGLLGRTDEDLEEGGLPRDEVEEGLKTLKERPAGSPA